MAARRPPKASQRSRLQTLMGMLNDLEMKGQMRELLGTTASWQVVEQPTPIDSKSAMFDISSELPTHQGTTTRSSDCDRSTMYPAVTHSDHLHLLCIDHEYALPQSLPSSHIARKRKMRGKEKCIQEASAVLRALQTKHECLLRIRQELLAARRESESAQHSLRSLVPDRILRTVLPNRPNLYVESFLQSETVRFLIPLELTEDSVLVDCTEGFAQMAGGTRDSLIHGVRFCDMCVRCSFLRFQQLGPIIASCGAMFLRNAPGWIDSTVYDIIISTEAEAQPISPFGAASSAGHTSQQPPAKKRQLRRHIQIVLLNPRPMVLKAGPNLSASSATATASDTSSRSSQSPVNAVEPSDRASFTAAVSVDSHPSNSDSASQASCPLPRANLEQVTFMEPLRQRLDDPVRNVGWVSVWSDDTSGSSDPTPLVRIEGDVVRHVQSFFDRSNVALDAATHIESSSAAGADGMTGMVSMAGQDLTAVDPNLVPANDLDAMMQHQTPVVNFYTTAPPFAHV